MSESYPNGTPFPLVDVVTSSRDGDGKRGSASVTCSESVEC